MRMASPALPYPVLHACLALALLGGGCKAAPTLPEAPKIANTGATLFSVSIANAPQQLSLGDSLALKLEGEDDQGLPMNVAKATWKSSDASVASVASDGTLKGLKRGNVTITATTSNPPREATATIQIVGAGEAPKPSNTPIVPDETPTGYVPPGGLGEVPAGGTPAPAGMSLTVFPQQPRLLVGGSVRLMAYSNTGGAQATAAAQWRSSDATIATVDEAGMVKGLKAGTVTITASSLAYPALRSQVTLTVSAPVPATQVKGITIKPSSATMNVGETFWLLAEVATWAGGYDPNIRWVSGNPAVVTVSETGEVTAVAPGKTTVTAIALTYDRGELSAVVPIEVRNVAGTSR